MAMAPLPAQPIGSNGSVRPANLVFYAPVPAAAPNGRNSNLLLNVPPNNQGKLDDAAVKVLAEVGTMLKQADGKESR
jgi:hypothetical protein